MDFTRTLCAGLLLVSVVLIAGCAGNNNPPVTLTVAKDFGNEEKVTLLGYEGSAMEPFISRDGQWLFWNSLNDGQDTSLYYASRVDENTFQLGGKLEGVNNNPPHLDAVGSMDSSNNFYFVSTREWPANYKNYFSGTFANGKVTNVHRVEGNFYIEQPGWIVMDAEISPDGTELFYVNARFAGGALPAESHLHLARLVDGKFTLDQSADTLLKTVNDRGIVYAPAISQNGLELYFTELKDDATKILVARRSSRSAAFGLPELIDIKGSVPEGPSITSDGQDLYYHKLVDGTYRIYKMSRIP